MPIYAQQNDHLQDLAKHWAAKWQNAMIGVSVKKWVLHRVLKLQKVTLPLRIDRALGLGDPGHQALKAKYSGEVLNEPLTYQPMKGWWASTK